MRRASRRWGVQRGVLALIVACGVALASCTSDVDKIAQYVANSEALLADGMADEALTELRNALRLNPQDADLNFRIGRILETEFRFEDAIFFYGETQRLDPRRIDAALGEARLLIHDDPARCKEILKGVLEREPETAEAYVILSRRALIESKLPAALRLALTAVELDDQSGMTHLHLGKVHQARILELQLNKKEVDPKLFQKAMHSLELAAELGSEFHAIVAAVEHARVLSIWEGHQAEAVAAYRRAVAAAAASSNPALHAEVFRKSRSYAVQINDPKLLRWTLEQLVSVDPGNLPAWMHLARIRQSHDQDGEEVLKQLLEQRPDDPQAHVMYARFLANLGRLDDAADHLEDEITRGTDPPVLLSVLMNILYTGQQTERAEAALQRLLRDHPDHPETLIARAQRSIADQRLDDAAAELTSLLGTVERFDAYQMLAVTEKRRGNPRKALEAVGRAIELSRGRGQFPTAAVRLRSELQAELGNCDEALRGLSTIASKAFNLQLGDRLLQARCLYQVGRARVGRSVLGRIVDGKNPDLRAVLTFADLEVDRDPKRVRALLERALTKYHGLAPILVRVARLDFREGHPQRALVRLNRAIETGRADVSILMERARVLASTGDIDAAHRDAMLAFQSNPGEPGASALLLSLYRAQGRTQEAIASFEEAMSVGALQPPARVLLSKLHLQAGNNQRAREIQEALLAQNLDLPEVKNDLAFLLAREGQQLDRALQLAQEAQRSLSRQPAVVDTLGFVYLQRGMNQPALEQFRYALKLAEETTSPLQAVFHYHEGLALRRLERFDEASVAFEEALALDADFEDASKALQELKAAVAKATAQQSS